MFKRAMARTIRAGCLGTRKGSHHIGRPPMRENEMTETKPTEQPIQPAPDVSTMPLADDRTWRSVDAGLPRNWQDRD